MNVYADNAATTKMSRKAIDAMIPYMETEFGNPSSLHTVGQRANEALVAARERVAKCLGCEAREITFTSGGSEADNQAIMTAAAIGARKGKKHIISTAFVDDGYLNGLTAVLPILEETGMKATISVVGAYTEMSIEQNDPNPAYAYLTWDDIQTLAASGRVEIGNHTWAMHDLKPRKGTQKCSGESVESYQAALRTDLTELQTCLREKSGVTPTVFAYPYGCISPEALPVLKELGFQAALTCDERINTLTGNSDELYSLGRFNRPSGISTADFMFQAGIG